MKRLLTRQDLRSSVYNNSQSGQIAVIVLLLMVVMMTIGLSLASRTTEELFLSNQQTESARVFNAAESGIEEVLSMDIEGGSIPDGVINVGDSTVNYSVTPGDTIETELEEGKSLLVDLGGVSGDVIIEWWNNSDSSCGADPAGLIISSYYTEASATKAKFLPFWPCGSGYSVPTGSASSPYKFRQDVTVGSTTKFLRIKAVYNDTAISVRGATGLTLPPQSHTIRSTATNAIGTENETRSVEVKRTLSTAPSFMEYALYTPSQLNKN